MPVETIITEGMSGVDMSRNALLLSPNLVAAATNMSFDENRLTTRPAMRHTKIAEGGFQGACAYSPSKGLSSRQFSTNLSSIAVMAGNKLFVSTLTLKGELLTPKTILGAPVESRGHVSLFQAENYLIAQAPDMNTFWWDGEGAYVLSPGLKGDHGSFEERVQEANVVETKFLGGEKDCCFRELKFESLDPVVPDTSTESDEYNTFDAAKIPNWLVNGAGLGVYANARIHQETAAGIYAGDILHKRGVLKTDDLLCMTEQQTLSHGVPLAAPSKLGSLTALLAIPRTDTGTGDGALIGYYQNGAVAYPTGDLPRETRRKGNGDLLQEGWNEKMRSPPILNRVSAVGPYAVTALPRDHVFRSKYGIHFLNSVRGNETFRSEAMNVMSHPVAPLLDADNVTLLDGVAISEWIGGNRIFATTGMTALCGTPLSVGKGFVSYNQAVQYTRDRSPIPTWEGLWLADSAISGFHAFVQPDSHAPETSFAGISSDKEDNIYATTFNEKSYQDVYQGQDTPVDIEWSFTTRKFFGNSLTATKALQDGSLRLSQVGRRAVRVLCRSDRNPAWRPWGEENVSAGNSNKRVLRTVTLGKPHRDVREGAWFQFKVEGVGHAQDFEFSVNYSDDGSQMDSPSGTIVMDEATDNPYIQTESPISARWSKLN